MRRKPHLPEFTVIYQLVHIKCTRTVSTKNGAEPPGKLFRVYREFEQVPVISQKLRIHYRQNVSLRLPEEDSNEAKKILLNDSSAIYSTVE